MSGKHVIQLDAPPAEALVDADGLLLASHVAAGPYVKLGSRTGELLLCGAVLMHDTYAGVVPGAPTCPTCEAKDY